MGTGTTMETRLKRKAEREARVRELRELVARGKAELEAKRAAEEQPS
jgi:hypothetical protein